jgi:eukaryotic-like serine/threonine-protein kinase
MPMAETPARCSLSSGTALAAAHRAGVVHRDLKPENIFIASSKQQGQRFKVKILDFGIAKLTAEAAHRTQMTMSLGTPRWMAPEQTGGAQMISCATDVWALGLIAYWMLTGRYYWKHAVGGPSDSVMTLMREVLFEPLVPASLRAREQGVAHLLPGGLRRVVRARRRTRTGARFADGGAAVGALVPLLSGAAQPRASSGAHPGVAVRTGQLTDVFGETVARSLRRPPGQAPGWRSRSPPSWGSWCSAASLGVLLVKRPGARGRARARGEA